MKGIKLETFDIKLPNLPIMKEMMDFREELDRQFFEKFKIESTNKMTNDDESTKIGYLIVSMIASACTDICKIENIFKHASFAKDPKDQKEIDRIIGRLKRATDELAPITSILFDMKD